MCKHQEPDNFGFAWLSDKSKTTEIQQINIWLFNIAMENHHS